jgi:hypothetical protein
MGEEVVDKQGTAIGTFACYWQSVSRLLEVAEDPCGGTPVELFELVAEMGGTGEFQPGKQRSWFENLWQRSLFASKNRYLRIHSHGGETELFSKKALHLAKQNAT